LDRAPFKADAVIVDADLKLHVSEGMKPKLVMRAELTEGKLPAGDWPL
jgi:hypothetical protein